LTRQKSIKGFQTEDMVVATVPTGVNTGVHKGRVAVRATGSFNIKTVEKKLQGISHKHCRIVARADGYSYSIQSKMILTEDRSNEKQAA
jgi:hypothetical protein